MPLNADEEMFDKEGNFDGGSDYEMSIGQLEIDAEAQTRLDESEDTAEPGLEARRHATGSKGKGKEGPANEKNETTVEEGMDWQ